MKDEEIFKLWNKYLENVFKYQAACSPDLHGLFTSSCCITCAHWVLLREDDIEGMKVDFISPMMHESIWRDMKRVYEYEDVKFYGYCKRYPPILCDSDHYDYKHKQFISLTIRNMDTRKFSQYRFPITHQAQWCGEWKRGKSYWCERSFLIEMADAYLKGEHLEKKGSLPERWEVFFQD